MTQPLAYIAALLGGHAWMAVAFLLSVQAAASAAVLALVRRGRPRKEGYAGLLGALVLPFLLAGLAGWPSGAWLVAVPALAVLAAVSVVTGLAVAGYVDAAGDAEASDPEQAAVALVVPLAALRERAGSPEAFLAEVRGDSRKATEQYAAVAALTPEAVRRVMAVRERERRSFLVAPAVLAVPLAFVAMAVSGGASAGDAVFAYLAFLGMGMAVGGVMALASRLLGMARKRRG